VLIYSFVYKITAVLKVETDIIVSIAGSKPDRTSCDTSDNVCRDLQNYRYCFFRWRKNVFDVTLTDNFQNQSQFLHMRVTNWPTIFVDQGQFSDPDFISGTYQRENVQFADIFDLKIFQQVQQFHSW